MKQNALIKSAQNTPEGYKIILNAALHYLWDSGEGCQNNHVWDWLPKVLLAKLIAEYLENPFVTLCLINKKTARMAYEHFRFNPKHSFDRTFLLFCKNLNWRKDIFKNETIDKWNSYSYKIYGFKNIQDYMDVLSKNPHISPKQINNACSYCYEKCNNRDGPRGIWTDLLHYISKPTHIRDIVCRLMKRCNPFRDSRDIIMLLKKLEYEFEKDIHIETIEMDDYSEVLKPPIKEMSGNELEMYEIYQIYAKECYNIILPKIEK